MEALTMDLIKALRNVEVVRGIGPALPDPKEGAVA